MAISAIFAHWKHHHRVEKRVSEIEESGERGSPSLSPSQPRPSLGAPPPSGEKLEELEKLESRVEIEGAERVNRSSPI